MEDKMQYPYQVRFMQKGDNVWFCWDNYETEAEAKEVAEALPGAEMYENIVKAWVVNR